MVIGKTKQLGINIVAFGLNDFLKDQLKKGKKFYIEGRIDHNSYEKDGQNKILYQYYFRLLMVLFLWIEKMIILQEHLHLQVAHLPKSAPMPNKESDDTADDLPF